MKAWRGAGKTLLSALLPFLMVELGLRISGWHPAIDRVHFGFGPADRVMEPRDGWWVVRPFLRPVFRARPVPVGRAPGERRLVVLGDSVTWGHRSNEDPDPLEAWADVLEERIRGRPGGEGNRVVNLAARGWSSRRVLGLLPQALSLNPDAVLVSFGSSEFLEEATWKGWEARQARRPEWFFGLRTVAAIEQILARARGEPARGLSALELAWRDEALEAPYLAAGRNLLGDGSVDRVPEEAERRVEIMARACEEAKVPMVLLTVPSNLRWPPEGSRYADDEERRQAVEVVSRAGRLIDQGRYAEALAIIEPAARSHPGIAAIRYRWAQALDGTGDREGALVQYEAARDLAAFPLRAGSGYNDRLRAVAARHPSVVLVDIDRACREWVPDGIPDDRLFLDQNHLREEAHRRVAEAVLEALEQRGLVPGEPGSS
ncbi:hypothetical protein KBD49_15525 [Myxococcota bacterium]|nr:hypothetical protein [Myxococcota bacterium]